MESQLVFIFEIYIYFKIEQIFKKKIFTQGIVLVFKRLTLTPLLAYSAHMHQLHSLCPLTFETKLTTIYNSQNLTNDPSQKIKNKTSSVKKTQSLMLTLGRALAPLHEDLYLSSNKYRVDALRKYANSLILCSWNTNNNE